LSGYVTMIFMGPLQSSNVKQQNNITKGERTGNPNFGGKYTQPGLLVNDLAK